VLPSETPRNQACGETVFLFCGAGDDAARGHLRNIELYLQRLLAEAEQGRAQSTAELRSDIRILTRTVAALAETPHG